VAFFFPDVSKMRARAKWEAVGVVELAALVQRIEGWSKFFRIKIWIKKAQM
jgi:hypothetical protein